MPAAGTVTSSGEVGYLPQDPRTGDLDVLARDRILVGPRPRQRHPRAARRREADGQRGRGRRRQGHAPVRAARRRVHLPAAGTPPSPRPRRIASALGLPERILAQPLHTLSGGQRRRVELARILFSGAETLLLDEPTNHLDADSIVWLRDYLKAYKGGLVIISHDVELLDTVVNRVFHLDANRAAARPLQRRLEGLPRPARDRRAAPQARARRTPRRRPAPSWPRPTRCGPRRPRPSPRRTWPGAPSGCCPASRTSASRTGSPSCASPTRRRAARRRCARAGCRGPTARWRSSPTSTWPSTAGSRVVVLGLNGAGKTTLLRMLAGVDKPDTGPGRAGPRPQARLLRPGAREPRRATGPCWRT